MKILFAIILLFTASFCFGQKKMITASSAGIPIADNVKLNQLGLDDSKEKFYPLDALNGAYILEADKAAKYARKADSAKWEIVKQILTISKADFSRISIHPDSLIVKPEGITTILKHKKK